MTTLKQFIMSCQHCFTHNDQETVSNELCRLLSKSILNRQFLNDCFGQIAWVGKKVLYEDDHYGFCICGHISHEVKEVQPHNHGSTWAIYGQESGQTYMTEWQQVMPPEAGSPGKAKKTASYTLAPGDVYYYKTGQIHSLTREPGRLIRIEGQNVDRLNKALFEPV